MSDPGKRVAIIVEPSIPLGLLANTVATIGIGIGAIDGELGRSSLTDVAGRSVKTSANCPVPILQASPEMIQTVLVKALPAPEGGFVVPFPAFARKLHVFADYLAAFSQRDLAQERIEGLGLVGPARWVTSLTGSFKLLR